MPFVALTRVEDRDPTYINVTRIKCFYTDPDTPGQTIIVADDRNYYVLHVAKEVSELIKHAELDTAR